LCAIAGARIAKELHKKGATTGTDAFESFKSCYERFNPSPYTLIDIPIPEEDETWMTRKSSSSAIRGAVASYDSFEAKFDTILKKIQWSPSAVTGTSRTSIPSSSNVGGGTVSVKTNKRPLESGTTTAVAMDIRYDVKRIRS
jgi:hypothetical protein